MFQPPLYNQRGTKQQAKKEIGQLPQIVSRLEQITREFDETSFITDEEFNNYNCLTQQQIQDFLAAKGSGLSQQYCGKLPSQMIYDSAQKYLVSPIMLLAMLQTEQSLVSNPSPSERQLDWALGYGKTDDRTIERFRGLENQIMNAARTLRISFDTIEIQNPRPKVSEATDLTSQGEPIFINVDYGQRSIHPANKATFARYKYTPHTGINGGGNKLFFEIFRGYTNYFARRK